MTLIQTSGAAQLFVWSSILMGLADEKTLLFDIVPISIVQKLDWGSAKHDRNMYKSNDESSAVRTA